MAEAAVTRPAPAVAHSRGDALDLAPSFPDLVWAHHQWEKSRRDGDHGDARLDETFRRTLAGFEEKYGALVSVYWSRNDASAVAITVKELPPWRHLLGIGNPQVRFHRATDWVTSGIPAIPDALNACETLAAKVGEVLRSTSERVAMQWIFSIASHLLGYVERAGAAEHRRDAARVAHEARLELHEVDDYYDRAGMKTGRIVYASGMVYGIIGLIVLGLAARGLLVAFGTDGAHGAADRYKDVPVIFSCYTAGALGAIVSVMSRMASPRNVFAVDYEVGRPALRLLGSFRPLLGAIFGVTLYFAVKGHLLQIEPNNVDAFYWYTALSFVAGFSERFTKVLLDSAEGVVPSGRTSTKRTTRSRTSAGAGVGDEDTPVEEERPMEENGA